MEVLSLLAKASISEKKLHKVTSRKVKDIKHQDLLFRRIVEKEGKPGVKIYSHTCFTAGRLRFSLALITEIRFVAGTNVQVRMRLCRPCRRASTPRPSGVGYMRVGINDLGVERN